MFLNGISEAALCDILKLRIMKPVGCLLQRVYFNLNLTKAYDEHERIDVEVRANKKT